MPLGAARNTQGGRNPHAHLKLPSPSVLPSAKKSQGLTLMCTTAPPNLPQGSFLLQGPSGSRVGPAGSPTHPQHTPSEKALPAGRQCVA